MRRWPLLLALVLAVPGALRAQTADELAVEAANPLADMISFPIQLNNDFGLGEFDRTRNVLNVQPVIPLFGGKVITRTILPFLWLPDITSESGSFSSGLSDMQFTAFYVPESPGIVWGFGPILEMPTGGSERGSEKWSAGPSAVVLHQAGPWTLGALANNVWSFAGEEDRGEVNRGLLQYFVVLQLGDGWYVNAAPIITANWEADSDDRWVVPFGAGAGKLVFLGPLPINTQIGAYYNAVKPDLGPDWQFRVQIQTIVPTRGG